jgi:hypothetical protein
MSIKRRLLSSVSALILGSNLFSPFASAQTIRHEQTVIRSSVVDQTVCSSIDEKYAPQIAGSFGVGNCFSGEYFSDFDPEDSDEKDYSQCNEAILHYLQEYRQNNCSRLSQDSDLFNKTVASLLTNLLSLDSKAQKDARFALSFTDIFQHEKKILSLEDLVNKSRNEVLSLSIKYYKASSAEERRSIKSHAVNLMNYQENVIAQAWQETFLALALREQSPSASLEDIAEEIAEGERVSREAYHNINQLGLHLSSENYVVAYNAFRKWRQEHEKSYSSLLETQRKALSFASEEAGRTLGSRLNITYIDHDGQQRTVLATKDFVINVWGKNDDKLYRPIERMRAVVDYTRTIEFKEAKIPEEKITSLNPLVEKERSPKMDSGLERKVSLSQRYEKDYNKQLCKTLSKKAVENKETWYLGEDKASLAGKEGMLYLICRINQLNGGSNQQFSAVVEKYISSKDFWNNLKKEIPSLKILLDHTDAVVLVDNDIVGCTTPDYSWFSSFSSVGIKRLAITPSLWKLSPFNPEIASEIHKIHHHKWDYILEAFGLMKHGGRIYHPFHILIDGQNTFCPYAFLIE